MQALSRNNLEKLLLLSIFTFSILATPLALAQSIGILIDRSLSVDQDNRDEAIDLIIDLLEGDVDPLFTDKWAFLNDISPQQDPVQIKLRGKKQTQIKALLSGAENKGLADTNLEVLTGHFGELKTVHTLADERWVKAGKDIGEVIRAKAKSAVPSDPRTHFELAKATVSKHLNKEKEFLLFIVSDGVEDLDNWPISHYLDQEKINNLESLAKGDFRDTGKARHLRALNQKHYKNYSKSDQNKLKSFKTDYSELLLGRLSLRPNELKTFFKEKQKTVPVFIYVYHFKPKLEINPSFTTPPQSSLDDRYSISRDFSGVRWQLSSKAEATFPNVKQKLTLFDNLNNQIGQKDIDSQKASLNEVFGQIDDGLYKLVLTIESEGITQEAICYIEMSNYSPRIQFTGALAEITNHKNPLEFSRYDDLAPLDQKITWEYTSPKKDVEPPKTITKRLLNYDKEYNIPHNSDELRGLLLRTNQTEITIKDLLASQTDDTQIPLGGSYRVILEAVWSSGEKSSITSYFSLPEPEISLLSKSRTIESEDEPRIVEKGDNIRVANWMHGWKNFEYDLEIEEKIGNSWEYVDSYAEESPLTIDNQPNGVVITVAKSLNNPLRYRVVFLPNEKTGLSDIIDPEDVSTDYGYLESKSFSITPLIFLSFAILAIVFFVWHFMRKK